MAQEEGGVLSREVIRNNDIRILMNFGFLEVASIAFFIAGTLFLNGDLVICADLCGHVPLKVYRQNLDM